MKTSHEIDYTIYGRGGYDVYGWSKIAIISYICLKQVRMTIIIKKNQSKATIQQLLSKIPRKKQFTASKYCGVLKLSVDPLKFQKEIRSEWE